LIIRPKQSIEEIYWADMERRYLKYETSELGDCPKCRYELQPGFVKCPQCGEELKVQCECCKVYISKNWKYCPYCGDQRLLRAMPNIQAPISQAVMQQSIQETKQIAAEAVEGKKTRYATRTGFFNWLFTHFPRMIGEKFKSMVVGMKPKKKVVVENSAVKSEADPKKSTPNEKPVNNKNNNNNSKKHSKNSSKDSKK